MTGRLKYELEVRQKLIVHMHQDVELSLNLSYQVVKVTISEIWKELERYRYIWCKNNDKMHSFFEQIISAAFFILDMPPAFSVLELHACYHEDLR